MRKWEKRGWHHLSSLSFIICSLAAPILSANHLLTGISQTDDTCQSNSMSTAEGKDAKLKPKCLPRRSRAGILRRSKQWSMLLSLKSSKSLEWVVWPQNTFFQTAACTYNHVFTRVGLSNCSEVLLPIQPSTTNEPSWLGHQPEGSGQLISQSG